MSNNAVVLTDIPNAGTDLEDYVAALYQATGYYIEKNLVERAPDEVLELDIVATYYHESQSSSMIVEAKGGKWGYPDIFKIVGWMQYLSQERGAFFIKGGSKDLASLRARVGPLGIIVVDFGDFSGAIETFTSAGLGIPGNEEIVHLWRYSNLIERKLMSYLLSYSKSNPELAGPREIVTYHRLVNDGIFFTKSLLNTIDLLYEAYKSHPKLSLACAQEIEGHGFDAQNAMGTSPLIGQAMRQGEPRLLQASYFAEHRARLAILRGAVNLLCAHPNGLDAALASGDLDDVVYYSLPATFHSGLNWLQEGPTFYRYAVLWQQFLWGWGGFYLQHRVEEEVAWISQYSGVPGDEIPRALHAFDEFFPTGEGWFTTAGWSDIRTVKMMPMVFQGLGVHHRVKQYDLTNIADIGGADYTVANLTRWYANTLSHLQ